MGLTGTKCMPLPLGKGNHTTADNPKYKTLMPVKIGDNYQIGKKCLVGSDKDIHFCPFCLIYI